MALGPASVFSQHSTVSMPHWRPSSPSSPHSDRAAYLPCLQSLNAVVSTVAAVAVCALLWRVHDPHAGALLTGQSGGVDWPPGGCQYGAQPYYFEDSGSAQFNDTPGEWRLRTFDSACEPRQLVEPLLNASRGGQRRADPLVILIFGDRCAQPLSGSKCTCGRRHAVRALSRQRTCLLIPSVGQPNPLLQHGCGRHSGARRAEGQYLD